MQIWINRNDADYVEKKLHEKKNRLVGKLNAKWILASWSAIVSEA